MDRNRSQIEIEREADEFILWIEEQEKLQSPLLSPKTSQPKIEPVTKQESPKKFHHSEVPKKTESTKTSSTRRGRSASDASGNKPVKVDIKPASKSKEPDSNLKHSSSPRIQKSSSSKLEKSSSEKRKSRSTSTSAVIIEKGHEKPELDHSFITFNSGQKPATSGMKAVAISERPVASNKPHKLDTETLNMKPNQYNTVAMIKKNQRQGIIHQNAEGIKLNDDMNEVIANVQGAKQIQALKADLDTCDDEERRRKETVLRIMAAKRNNK